MLFAEVSGSGLLAVAGIGAAVGLVVFLVGMQAEERSVVRSSLRRLEGYEVENVRDQELLNPLRDRAVAAVPGPLSEEFARMLGEVRAGSSRADAMRALELRCNVPEVRSFVLAILQADTFGVSIGRVLRAQADEMRIKRRQLAQERA